MVVTAKRLGFVTLFACLLGLAPAASADGFMPLPTKNGKKSKYLKVRFIKYDGSVNGQMVVEVKNASKARRSFSADGLYFVPKGDPEHAPQRLGASGPMLVVAKDGKTSAAKRKLSLAPGEVKRVRLEVFCIDSHRGSPGRSTTFSIASTRLPKKLRKKLSSSNRRIYRRYKRRYKGDIVKAKSAVQSNMWKERDADWVKLQGERKGEAAMKRHPHRHRHPMPRKHIYRHRIKEPLRK